MTHRQVVAVLLLGVIVTLSGCQGGGRSAAAGEVDSPLAGCEAMAGPPAQATGAPPPAGSGEPLPDLTLPCFTGGEPVRLADLRGPAVVNLWASWCPPCREELPELQQYADQAAERVHVFGVVTEESRPAAAAALATDLGVRFPALDDPAGRLKVAVGAYGLPVTLFLDAAGQIRFVHTNALDRLELERLVRDHLGVPA